MLDWYYSYRISNDVLNEGIKIPYVLVWFASPTKKNKKNYVLFVIRMTKGRQTAIGYSNMVGCSHSQRWACKVLLLVLLLEA